MEKVRQNQKKHENALITRRSEVQILPPQPQISLKSQWFRGLFISAKILCDLRFGYRMVTEASFLVTEIGFRLLFGHKCGMHKKTPAHAGDCVFHIYVLSFSFAQAERSNHTAMNTFEPGFSFRCSNHSGFSVFNRSINS